MESLRKKLLALDTKSYKAYKTLSGIYHFPNFILSIDHVQGDPFATPSRISIRMDANHAGFPYALWQTTSRRIALEDYIGRGVKQAIDQHVKGQRGSGGSGEFAISVNGQQVLMRNAVTVNDQFVEIRLTIGLPAHGRRAAGHEAIAMMLEELPGVVDTALCYHHLDEARVLRHIQSIEDQDALRVWLHQSGHAAFIADGAILPRASGVDDRPLRTDALAFCAPESLAHTVNLPNGGSLRGLAIPLGITLIVGGGFHGKSTLLQALECGVYNHIPDDGRERVVCVDNAVKIRAEDNRAITRVNISPFIDKLPFGRDTVEFSTQNASGSTSQAANIIEALECGSQLLLIDEDTSATNFMIRDERMQALVSSDKEPITPFIHRVRELYEDYGVSSVIVMGGSGDYFDVADTVIMMEAYEPRDVTSAAKALAFPTKPYNHPDRPFYPPFYPPTKRHPDAGALNPARGQRAIKITNRSTHELLYGEHSIDLSGVEQLINIGQTRSIGLMIHYYSQHHSTPDDTFINGLKKVIHHAEQHGLDAFSPYKVGNLALPRLHELAAAINRIRKGQQQ
ncbi:MAG: ABC-ATPase domain-containing protein [Ectothiorhodospiraceae bacterium]|nr:ABC-ATPase domain-containing protein [Ectothiorhodospiraceae bacterium]